MARDLSQSVNNWTQSAGAAQQRYVDGINNTSVDPTQRAIASQGALLANFQNAVTSGRWARALSNAGKAKWQQNAIAKAGNYSTGIAAGEQAYATAMQVWLPRIHQAAASAKSMPAAVGQPNNHRSAAFANALFAAKRSGA